MSSTPYTTDTSPEAEAVQLELLRRMTGQERLEKAMALSQQVRKMCWDSIRRDHPELDEQETKLKFIELTYGATLAEEVRRYLQERASGRHG